VVITAPCYLRAIPFIWKCLPSTGSFSRKSNSFSYRIFSTRTRFETEAKGNSETAFQFCINYATWLALKTRATFHPIKSETKSYRYAFAHVFPRFASATCNYFEFWLVHSMFCVLCDWLKWLLWFWFYDTQLKTAL